MSTHDICSNVSMKLDYFNHLLCFILPLNTFLFLLTAPHHAVGALVWTLPFGLILLLDWQNVAIKSDSQEQCPELYFDSILYALTALQVANIYLMLVYVSQLPWGSTSEILTSLVNLIVIRFLVGTSSGTSGIVVAHELLHRPQQSSQLLSRLLLLTVCYEHFASAHMQSHHNKLGQAEDIATAKYGESFKDYWQRVRLGYLQHAYHLEQERLLYCTGRSSMLYNKVIQGLGIEAMLCVLIIVYFGWVAVFMFLYQAFAAIRILEAVNYFQHWGLESGKYGGSYGWVSTSCLSRYMLIGLSHHIGHHESDTIHYHKIAFSEQGPHLPYGYFMMNLWVKLFNDSYQKMAVQGLESFQQDRHLQGR